ncbi:hypothetical protein EIZ47_10955 [Chryseobacterium lacus]|uniref:Tetratricopeptide repeat protein n=1 Tax=Chryseobacterium lacus TaxID=2058346 RepID=A0A368MVX1_9FLAO|nr:DUF6624 domain-containing protein [Chryseobacterium lacus]RCU42090.1 hypothetical protein DQ356_11085 [Chryseobacterium lacus]RST26208.1 hypothetical protein EIZ47_10955 [Chryseobacterium lacus]
MKQIITTFLLFICSLTFGQTYKSIVAEADAFYNNKEYKKSVEKYKEAFKLEQKSGNDFYNAGCSASLLGDKKLAFKWLNLALKNGWSNVRHLKSDADLTTLHTNKKWEKLVSEMQLIVDKREANYDKPLQAKLIAIFEDDQQIRREYISAEKEFGRESRQVDSLGKIMMYKDSINLIKVTEILDKYGWVGADKVGGQANQTLFLVIQHSDLKTQQKYLPMMREAVKNKNASGSALALLEDRVALGEGKRQIYGSQIGYDNVTNKSYVLPLDDPDNVDKRRAEVGLGLLADYVKRWDIIWNVEEYKKQLPELEEKQKRQK